MDNWGLLNIDKPAGLTSRDVVNRIQRLARPRKVGHAGTLDPLATGVLVVCLGPATRLIVCVQQMSKRYRGEFLLGRKSDTEDIEGQVVELPDAPQPEPAQIEAALPQFIGEILQRPPAYSALKVDGKRAYRLARQGLEVELAPRPVHIERIDLVEYEYPRMTLEIICGSGTYIRSLGRDLAEALGTAAVMSALVRTAIGPFRLEEACRLEELSAESLDDRLLPPTLAVQRLPRVTLTDEQRRRIAKGMTIPLDTFAFDQNADSPIAAFDAAGRLAALLVPRDKGMFGPGPNFIAQEAQSPRLEI